MKSPDNFSLLNTNLQEDDGSIVGKLDLNPEVSKDGVRDYNHANEVWSGSSLLHAVVRSEKPESPQYELYNDSERTHSYRGGETGAVYTDKLSTLEEAGNLQTEVEMEDPPRFRLLKLSPEVDNSYQHEDMKENSPHNEVLMGSLDNLSENLQREKTETVHEVMEQEDTVHPTEDNYYSAKFSLNNGDIDGRITDVHAVGHTTKSSVSPVRRASVSPERSPDLHGKVSSSPQDHHESLYSFRSSRREVSRSPEGSGGNGRRSLSARQISPSPSRQSRLQSPCRAQSLRKRTSSSPRRRQLSPEHQRSHRSVSRSPSRQRDSYGSRRDRHDRSRSRSPHARDRYRRSPRSGDSRGFGFLSLERDEDADEAIRALDQTEWNGRIVLVEKSKSR
ncbi:hypothetical protein AQUCO_00600228v1 [Aquilegia coerulea]|uniref:RRM domain-containing protein n=1 Tax=Aquilegia coerulea TaxID=218851 RepID=A0A2G5ENR3_AQUCA|nr:hypothetical protein AQUCO_00600228v1 [Aquilegia coerulea]